MKKICPEGILWLSRDQDSALSLPWLGVQYLVRGLRSCKLHGTGKKKNKTKKQCAHLLDGFLPKDMPRIRPLQKPPFLHNLIHHSTIRNGQEGGTPQRPSTNEWIKTGADIQWSVIQPSETEKSGTWYNMDVPWGYDTKWNLLVTTGQIPYDSTHMRFSEGPNSERQKAEWFSGAGATGELGAFVYWVQSFSSAGWKKL